MYIKGTALELQFSPDRLNDAAGDPFWIDLSAEEAAQLLAVLQERLRPDQPATVAPAVFSLDEPEAATVARAAADAPPATAAPAPGLQQWICLICGWVYDEAEGLPEDGIPPGTRWEDVPDDWRCPLCDVGKEDFAMVPL